MQPLTLNTALGTLAANLYLPTDVDNPPVVIITGAWTSVKEQMPANYAKAMAERGFAALTFDFRGWGKSRDSLQFYEDPVRKTDDIRAVIEAVKTISGVDANRIAGLGVCASSGYMLDAVADNPHVKAAAVAAPWLHNNTLVHAIYGGDEGVTQRLDAADKAAASKTPVYIAGASMTDDTALMYQAPYYTETDRGLIPEYDNQFNVASWRGWLTYDPISRSPDQDKPTLLVASEAMAVPAGTHAYLEHAPNNVDVLWLDNVNQFEFYDKPEAVNAAADAIAKHFNKHL